jgi:hypothetical protein
MQVKLRRSTKTFEDKVDNEPKTIFYNLFQHSFLFSYRFSI